MPAPSSLTRQPPSASRVTSIRVARPAMASSTELSTTSQTRWCSPVGPVEPMYMPGRLRTASSPSRMVMSSSVYDAPASPGLSSTFTATGAPFQNIGLRGAYRIPEMVTSGLSMRTHHSTRQRLQFGTSERSAATATDVSLRTARRPPPGGRSRSPPAPAGGPGSDPDSMRARVAHAGCSTATTRTRPSTRCGRRWPPSSLPTSSSQRVNTASMTAGVGAEPSRPSSTGHGVAQPVVGRCRAATVVIGPQALHTGAAGPRRSPREAAPPS